MQQQQSLDIHSIEDNYPHDFGRRRYSQFKRLLGYRQIFFSIGGVLVIWLFGATVFPIIEHWSALQGFYFSSITLTTVGYGKNLQLSRTASKVVLIFFAFIGLGVIGLAVSVFSRQYAQRAKKRRTDAKLRQYTFLEKVRVDDTLPLKERIKGLTQSRILRCITMFVLQLILGSIIFGLIEKWSVIDAIYFTVCTITTTGYGDIEAETKAGMTMVIFFVLLGLVLRIYTLCVVTDYSFHIGKVEFAKDSQLEVRKCFGITCDTEKRKISFLFSGAVIVLLISALIFAGIEGWDVQTGLYFVTTTVTTIAYGDYVPKTLLGKIYLMFFVVATLIFKYYMLSVIQRRSAKTHFMKKSWEKQIVPGSTDRPPWENDRSLIKRFLSMSIQKQLIVAFITTLIIYFVGAGLFKWWEDWRMVDACYFMAVTLTSIGYGDPNNKLSHGIAQLFVIFFAFFGEFVVSFLIVTIQESSAESTRQSYQKKEERTSKHHEK